MQTEGQEVQQHRKLNDQRVQVHGVFDDRQELAKHAA